METFYAVFVPPNCDQGDGLQPEELVFTDIKSANAALKEYKGSRMKTFDSKEKALNFLNNPDRDASFIDDPALDLAASLENLSIKQEPDEFPAAKPDLLNRLRRQIEAGDYEAVEETIWSNPRCLVTVCDSAVYLMAGPKYNACHIAARANKPDIMALILVTISNISFIRKLYPKEPSENVQDRLDHLLDSYLNTPDPRQGNTPLHYACIGGHYRVVRVLLTFEGCDLTLRNSSGLTAEECICIGQKDGGDSTTKSKIKNMFKSQLHQPLRREQLKKLLKLAKRRSKEGGAEFDSDNSFSDDSFVFSPTKKTINK